MSTGSVSTATDLTAELRGLRNHLGCRARSGLCMIRTYSSGSDYAKLAGLSLVVVAAIIIGRIRVPMSVGIAPRSLASR
ncbi:hypothetical protein [Saccharopolyspora shandongensis]|uniref:hypothetical protein n=1 Tax=Saccharopolyspora shandongensis TaxID=418495 RepID=UPI0033CF45FE